MGKVLEALMNEESHKECLQARGRHRQTDNPSSCRNITEKEDQGNCLNLLLEEGLQQKQAWKPKDK